MSKGQTIAPPGYLSVREVAERLGCSTGVVYKYINKCNMPAMRPRGTTRGFIVKETALQKWIETAWELL